VARFRREDLSNIFISQDLVNISTTIRNDLHFTNDIKGKVEQAVQDTIVATRIVDGFKNPQGVGGSGGGYLKDHAGFPLEYVMVQF
jgi:nucleoporin p58/p45